MKKIISIISIMLGVSSAWATIITDDFNRTAGMNSTGQTIGSEWHSSRTTGQWGIDTDRVVANMVEANSVLYNDALESVSGGGTNFTLSLDVTATGAYYAGVAFNYQDSSNFYYFRYKGDSGVYQMYSMADGVSVKLFGLTLAEGTFAADTDYTLTVASSDTYVFDYEIKDGGTILVSGTTTDSASSFTGGYAGILQGSTGAGRNSFDNFSLEVIPEPATLGLLAVCAAGALFIRRLQL